MSSILDTELFDDDFFEGAVKKCPTCMQTVKLYRWNLYDTAIEALTLYYKIGGIKRFVHTTTLKEHGYKGQGDAARLRHWGLVERDDRLRKDGGKSGMWRVTSKGEEFLKGEISIPKYVLIYNAESFGHDGDEVWIEDCMPESFDFKEMMNR